MVLVSSDPSTIRQIKSVSLSALLCPEKGVQNKASSLWGRVENRVEKDRLKYDTFVTNW